MPPLGIGGGLLAAGAGGGTAVVGGGAAATGGAAVSGSALAGLAAVIGLGALLGGDTPKPAEAVAALTPDQLAERLKKVQELSKGLAATAAAACATGNCCQRTVVISRSRAPLSARHIDDAQAMGYPRILTLDRPGTAERRAASLRGIPTLAEHDRDEYPPATFAENGGAASVRYVPLSDNRSAGRQILTGITGAPDGCRITIMTGP